MNQELEIEFKNMLSKDEYNLLLKNEFLNSDKHKIIQTNYYFDTVDSQLKKQGSALRIRIADSFMEMTLKTPSEGFLLETNIPLNKNEVSTILKEQQFKLSSYIKSDINLKLKNITRDTTFHLFNSMTTNRLEKYKDIHTIVLDQTTFKNKKIDYELEIESQEKNSGEDFFSTLLKKYEIPLRPAKPKIARAEYYRN